ncbi:MAG TPA: hypothetical protein VMA98_03010 [Candidatus Acidoferrales bacterium]|nr:hypothetical protein [Candidatus Acidoferrales bacterium]
MGGIGHHPLHPYVVQTAAFLGSLVMPAALLALLWGAWREKGRRRGALVPEESPD